MGNYQVRFLGDKGGVIRLSYPTNIMYKLITVILLAITHTCFSQTNLLFKPLEFKTIDWKNIQMDISDSTLRDLVNKSEILKGLYNNFGESILENCHPFDLNSDSYIDIVFYWQTSLQNQIIVFKNNGQILSKSYERFIDLTNIETNLDVTNIKLNGICYYQSVPPYAAGLFEINSNSTGDIVENEIVFYGETTIPLIFNKKQPFEILNDKYRLRISPEINNENVICELAKGDYGIALASSTDITGRIWWFVKMDNNISKTTEYWHIDTDTKNIRERKVLGWISSNYLKLK